MQNNRWVNIAGFKVLFTDDFKALCRLDAFKNHCLVNALGNRDIAIGPLVRVQSMWISFLPKLLVIKRFKPFLNFVTVFKSLHIPIVSDLGLGTQEKSTEVLVANRVVRFW